MEFSSRGSDGNDPTIISTPRCFRPHSAPRRDASIPQPANEVSVRGSYVEQLELTSREEAVDIAEDVLTPVVPAGGSILLEVISVEDASHF
jgi:hypothetical protein